MNRPLGRPANTDKETLTVRLPGELKLATAIRALEEGMTISALVQQALQTRLAAQVQR